MIEGAKIEESARLGCGSTSVINQKWKWLTQTVFTSNSLNLDGIIHLT